jgi:predicted RNase H-like HicB family nuclease
VPDLNVFATAKTREEVEQLVLEAVEFHIEGLRARNEEVPAPRFIDASYVEVA